MAFSSPFVYLIGAISVPIVSILFSYLIKKAETKVSRGRVLRNLYSLSSMFRAFFYRRLEIKDDEKHKYTWFIVSMFYTVIGYVSLGIVTVFYANQYVIFVIFIPLLLPLLYEIKSINDKFTSYHIMRSYSAGVLLALFDSLAIGLLGIAKTPARGASYAFLSLFLSVIVIGFAFSVYNRPLRVYEDDVFKERKLDNKVNVTIIAPYKQINGSIVGIGDFLLIKENDRTWSIDWHDVKGVALISEPVISKS